MPLGTPQPPSASPTRANGHRGVSRCLDAERAVLGSSRNNAARIEARDRRRVAAHEAGHIVTAQHFGVQILGPRVWRKTSTGTAAAMASMWTGEVRFIKADVERLSPGQQRLIACAGIAAEVEWFGCDTDVLLRSMSSVDRRAARLKPGADPSVLRRATIRATRLLAGSLRPAWIATMRTLIRQAG